MDMVGFRLVYALCMEVERMPVTIHRVRRWDQDVVNEPEK